MRSARSGLIVIVAGTVLWALCFTNNMSARDATGQQRQDYPHSQPGNIIIGNNKNITWEGPENSTVYIQVDYEAPRLVAVGRTGVQSVSWIMPGHLYVFTLRDANGFEIAQDQLDLRPKDRK